VTLKLSDKKAIVAEVAEVAGKALSAVAVDYRGITVSDMTALRVAARRSKVHLQVVRNTLARRALTGTSFECLNDTLIGPVLLAFSEEEPSAGARLMRDFAKTNDKLKVKALSLGGQLYSSQHLDAIAKLPTRIEGIALLLGVMQAPISKFVRTLAEVPTKLVRGLSAVRDQKQ
jgi:large subunit ribosomal protein L10